MASINNISVKGFKTLFKRDFPYLPLYKDDKAYFINDIVYYPDIDGNFYESLINGNLTEPTDTTNWKLTNDNTDNYIQDSDIERAFTEARVNFNPELFETDDLAEMIFYYLTAHYLVIDLNNAQNPLGIGSIGFTQSKSVGSVSESYAIPQWMLNSKTYGLFGQTGYGRKYLSLIQPYVIGNIIFAPGRTTYG